MKIGIGFAAYISNDKHLDFAMQTLRSIVSKEHELVFMCHVNYAAKMFYITSLEDRGVMVRRNDENIVSLAWNRGIEGLLEMGCRYVLTTGLDLVFKSNCVDNLVRVAEENPEHLMWTGVHWHDRDTIEEAPEEDFLRPNPDFSCFMVDHRLFEDIGKFDERLKPAYDEDLDMHYRIHIAGRTAVCSGRARFYHYLSQTILNDPELHAKNRRTHGANDAYFVRKWGDKPLVIDEEHTKKMYKVAFDGKL